MVALVTGIWTSPVISPQNAREIRGPSPLVAIENEHPPRLIVDPPLAGPLAAGKVFIQYRAENLRVVPVFGQGALQVSPRIGHIHVTVDDSPWHFVDASGETMRHRLASINEHPISVEDRKFHWPVGRRPDNYPELSSFGV